MQTPRAVVAAGAVAEAQWRGNDMDIVPEKVCGKCVGSFPATVEHFYAQKLPHRVRLSTYCRSCTNAATKVRWANSEAAKAAAERRAQRPSALEMAERKRFRKAIDSHNRRAREQNAPGTFSQADVLAQFARQKGVCWWCKEPLVGKYHADHVIPLARGGSNWPENIVCACKNCNLRKWSKMPWEFAGRLF